MDIVKLVQSVYNSLFGQPKPSQPTPKPQSQGEKAYQLRRLNSYYSEQARPTPPRAIQPRLFKSTYAPYNNMPDMPTLYMYTNLKNGGFRHLVPPERNYIETPNVPHFAPPRIYPYI